jgi:hypothetical protein
MACRYRAKEKTMSNEKIDNCEVSANSPLGGYGMAENTGNGILSGAISQPGRGLEEEMREKKGFFERLVGKKNERP